MTAALKKAEKALCKQGGPAEVPIHNVIFYNDKGVLKYKMAQGSSRSEELGTDMAKISFEVKKLLDTGIIMDLGKPKEARSARPKTTSATPAAAGGAAAAAAADVDDDDDDDDDVSAPMAAKTISAPMAAKTKSKTSVKTRAKLVQMGTKNVMDALDTHSADGHKGGVELVVGDRTFTLKEWTTTNSSTGKKKTSRFTLGDDISDTKVSARKDVKQYMKDIFQKTDDDDDDDDDNDDDDDDDGGDDDDDDDDGDDEEEEEEEKEAKEEKKEEKKKKQKQQEKEHAGSTNSTDGNSTTKDKEFTDTAEIWDTPRLVPQNGGLVIVLKSPEVTILEMVEEKLKTLIDLEMKIQCTISVCHEPLVDLLVTQLVEESTDSKEKSTTLDLKLKVGDRSIDIAFDDTVTKTVKNIADTIRSVSVKPVNEVVHDVATDLKSFTANMGAISLNASDIGVTWEAALPCVGHIVCVKVNDGWRSETVTSALKSKSTFKVKGLSTSLERVGFSKTWGYEPPKKISQDDRFIADAMTMIEPMFAKMIVSQQALDGELTIAGAHWQLAKVAVKRQSTVPGSRPDVSILDGNGVVLVEIDSVANHQLESVLRKALTLTKDDAIKISKRKAIAGTSASVDDADNYIPSLLARLDMIATEVEKGNKVAVADLWMFEYSKVADKIKAENPITNGNDNLLNYLVNEHIKQHPIDETKLTQEKRGTIADLRNELLAVQQKILTLVGSSSVEQPPFKKVKSEITA